MATQPSPIELRVSEDPVDVRNDLQQVNSPQAAAHQMLHTQHNFGTSLTWDALTMVMITFVIKYNFGLFGAGKPKEDGKHHFFFIFHMKSCNSSLLIYKLLISILPIFTFLNTILNCYISVPKMAKKFLTVPRPWPLHEYILFIPASAQLTFGDFHLVVKFWAKSISYLL